MTEPTPQLELQVAQKLRQWQKDLLDLSKANRSLYHRSTRTSTVPILEPSYDALYDLLVVRGRQLQFPMPPDKEEAEQEANARQTTLFEDDGLQPRPARRSRDELVCGEAPADLSRALYTLRSKARLSLQEQGYNVLYLAFGFLEWLDSDNASPIRSPIVLVPVALERENSKSPYTLSMFEDDVVMNPTLEHKLQRDFNVRLEELPLDMGSAELKGYLESLSASVRQIPGWRVVPEAILGIYSFQKIALYKDLEQHASLFGQHSLIRKLARLLASEPPILALPAEELDQKTHPTAVFQVLDADSSQQEAIEVAKQGASFILQGPPGTGKSQTIANIIAESLAAGKRVLFVSAKIAALEVVHRRLTEVRLAQHCLQLHSHKRDKREVVSELIKALEAPRLVVNDQASTALQDLESARNRLNQYVRALHQPRYALNVSAHTAAGKAVLLSSAALVPFDVTDARTLEHDLVRQRLDMLETLGAHKQLIEDHAIHPWNGIVRFQIPSALVVRIGDALRELVALIPAFISSNQKLAAACGLGAPSCLGHTEGLIGLLRAYRPSLFAGDVEGLTRRFLSDYTRFWRRWGGAYRTDSKVLAACRASEKVPRYQEAARDLQTASKVLADLGPVSPEPIQAAMLTRLHGQAADLSGRITAALSTLARLYGDTYPLIDNEPLLSLPWGRLLEWLSLLLAGIDRLPEWAAFQLLSGQAREMGLGPYVDMVLDRKLPGDRWAPGYEAAVWRSFVDAVLAEDDVLLQFNAKAQDLLVDKFRQLDRKQLAIASARIRANLRDRRPPTSWVAAASTEEAILRREGAKKRRLMPLRKLFSEIPDLILDLKPCLMMSPISVGMFLDPARYHFDLVIFDEASQIPPEEAAGAIARASQAIVVGDQKQLPPTRFFDALGEDIDDEENAASDEGLFDSILEECEGAGLRRKMLLWHYRSHHESLIAFSNYHFYGNRLYTFPSPWKSREGMGLRFVHVPDGIYRRGASQRRNDIEARKVVDLIEEHFNHTPHLTLGVVAFSMAQEQAIDQERNRRCLANPKLEAYLSQADPEEFFVKNLETVQGDERDTIIFSVGYGPDENGKISLNFGPLNRAGGQRRLNVAVTRAREQVILVSSVLPEQIDLKRTGAEGLRLLRQYMLVARDGMQALHADEAAREDAEFGSPFEESVYQALAAKGLALDPQVGVSGYRIDLGVKHPSLPGKYVLGIECDGVTYHSAATARDRDRLRQQVLESLGWRLLRIWSREWYSNRETEIVRVMNAYQDAIREKPAPSSTPKAKSEPAPDPPIDNDPPLVVEAHDPEAGTQTVQGYVTDTATRLPGRYARNAQAMHDRLSQVQDDVVRVVDWESPVHRDAVIEEVASAWGFRRVGSNIGRAIQQAIASAVYRRHVVARGDFLWSPRAGEIRVRAPAPGRPPRRIEHIAPEELAQAAFLCLRSARSLSREDLARTVASLVGYDRLGAHVDSRVQEAIDLLLASGRAISSEGKIRLNRDSLPPPEGRS